MLFGEMLDRERQEGKTEGRKDLLALVAAMAKAGRTEDIPKLNEDPEFLTEMLSKYHIDI